MAYASWSVVFGEQPSAAKWNILGTNDASFNDGTGIAVSAITPEKLLTGTGTTWPWQTWTPTWTNLTVSGSTVTARYIQIGKTVHCRVAVVLGGGNTPTGAVSFSLPVTSVAYAGTAVTQPLGEVIILDSGVSGYTGVLLWASTTTASPFHQIVNSNYATLQAVGTGGNTPFTMGNGDELHISGTYEAA